MSSIQNFTQHHPTIEQQALGVYSPPHHAAIRELLTFETPPDNAELADRARQLAALAARERDSVLSEPNAGKADTVMIGGAVYLMAPLEAAMRARNLKPVYAFAKRVVVERDMPDGTVKKSVVFKHEGFLDAYQPPQREPLAVNRREGRGGLGR